jgi:PPOX class probable F420-dependent enzyme
MPKTPVLTPQQIAYINGNPVSRLATADASGVPHLVPLCHFATESTVYLSNGPSTNGRKTKRVRNLAKNPRAAFLVDHYSEDWDKIGYVLVMGPVDLLDAGPELTEAVRLLKEHYHQWRDWPLDQWGVTALRVEQVVIK